jgi:hypothetical protein
MITRSLLRKEIETMTEGETNTTTH